MRRPARPRARGCLRWSPGPGGSMRRRGGRLGVAHPRPYNVTRVPAPARFHPPSVRRLTSTSDTPRCASVQEACECTDERTRVSPQEILGSVVATPRAPVQDVQRPVTSTAALTPQQPRGSGHPSRRSGRECFLEHTPPRGSQHAIGHPLQSRARMQEETGAGLRSVLGAKGAEVPCVPEPGSARGLDFDGQESAA